MSWVSLNSLWYWKACTKPIYRDYYPMAHSQEHWKPPSKENTWKHRWLQLGIHVESLDKRLSSKVSPSGLAERRMKKNIRSLIDKHAFLKLYSAFWRALRSWHLLHKWNTAKAFSSNKKRKNNTFRGLSATTAMVSLPVKLLYFTGSPCAPQSDWGHCYSVTFSGALIHLHIVEVLSLILQCSWMSATLHW